MDLRNQDIFAFAMYLPQLEGKRSLSFCLLLFDGTFSIIEWEIKAMVVGLV